jgi:hypothetical protein
MLIDATRKWIIPGNRAEKEFMERAKQLWERLELPKLKPQDHGSATISACGPTRDEEEAQLALKGEHYQTGEKRAKQRVPAKRK